MSNIFDTYCGTIHHFAVNRQGTRDATGDVQVETPVVAPIESQPIKTDNEYYEDKIVSLQTHVEHVMRMNEELTRENRLLREQLSSVGK